MKRLPGSFCPDRLKLEIPESGFNILPVCRLSESVLLSESFLLSVPAGDKKENQGPTPRPFSLLVWDYQVHQGDILLDNDAPAKE